MYKTFFYVRAHFELDYIFLLVVQDKICWSGHTSGVSNKNRQYHKNNLKKLVFSKKICFLRKCTRANEI